ncbi:hypothetical protein SAMN04489760_11849 [Syntrophus gentianae]|uniref:Uncharacterized protein n=1 Tax=Syntrophus gentianae TaxID=43775 RepID=A0A1H7YVM7_9BACT|nr:hypothetical protein [Syntrophus gentianae]SEM49961.1 hypothetical protein SAMN04489760_11849 [Syntrophus gentianae]
MKESSEESKSLAIEKQKTLRLFMIIAALLLLAAVGFVVLLRGIEKGGEGKMDVDFTGGKFSLTLQKPIVDQIKLGTAKTEGSGEKIEFTQGRINNPDVVNQIRNLGPANPTAFSGKNFISNDLRFLFSAEHPEKWQVRYNPAGLQNAAVPVYTIYNQEGSHLNIGVGPIPQNVNIQQFVALNIQTMFQAGMIQQMPQVTYDLPSETAFAVFTNPQTLGQSYQKVIINRERNQVFVASANYNQTLSSPEGVQDLLNMIATFTLF